MTFLKDWLVNGTIGSFTAIKNIALIVLPLMLFMEIAKDLKLLDLIGGFLKPVTRFFKTDAQSGFPLAVGLIFGISYGAGVLIKTSDDGEIDSRSMVIVSIFLALCHALFEDTLLFVAIGATGWIILTVRILAATLITWIVSRLNRQIDY
ncbi:nucleoside recognition domain-containing protein [Fusibacter tunisiensis]|uniref:Nucleoside transporter/FeoB GTPase Gate domain-containing protein n=1 Tax=Fusibacter tunisiensis TaxID=1008308 RepID=A0ABS2MQJ1_9FIRM|nr:nucleoside recognition domain-containing protein [Fusibacter tunisiensis]MBM7561671.1 hypothetical protein [Fusibacter tunisiensis]